MAKCNVPDCKGESGDMGLCVAHLGKYRGGDATLRQYLKDGSGREDHPTPPTPAALRCLVKGCTGDRSCRGLCASHYSAASCAPDGPRGQEALKVILAPTRGPGKGGDKKARGALAGFDGLIAVLRSACPQRFAVLRDLERDEITIIDKTGGKAILFKEASAVKVSESQLE